MSLVFNLHREYYEFLCLSTFTYPRVWQIGYLCLRIWILSLLFSRMTDYVNINVLLMYIM